MPSRGHRAVRARSLPCAAWRGRAACSPPPAPMAASTRRPMASPGPGVRPVRRRSCLPLPPPVPGSSRPATTAPSSRRPMASPGRSRSPASPTPTWWTARPSIAISSTRSSGPAANLSPWARRARSSPLPMVSPGPIARRCGPTPARAWRGQATCSSRPEALSRRRPTASPGRSVSLASAARPTANSPHSTPSHGPDRRSSPCFPTG